MKTETVNTAEKPLRSMLWIYRAVAARIWCDFNSYKWPSDMPDALKPEWWDNGAHSNNQHDWITPFMRAMENLIGRDACLEEWRRRQNPARSTTEASEPLTAPPDIPSLSNSAAVSGSDRCLVRLLGEFPSCCTDLSGDVWTEEAECIAEILRGTELIAERAYQEETNDYGVSFYWCEPGGVLEYPRCRDSVVMRLMGREVLKPISCGGGRTWIRFTERAAKVFELNDQAQRRRDRGASSATET